VLPRGRVLTKTNSYIGKHSKSVRIINFLCVLCLFARTNLNRGFRCHSKGKSCNKAVITRSYLLACSIMNSIRAFCYQSQRTEITGYYYGFVFRRYLFQCPRHSDPQLMTMCGYNRMFRKFQRPNYVLLTWPS
jgi:hypothetical protein